MVNQIEQAEQHRKEDHQTSLPTVIWSTVGLMTLTYAAYMRPRWLTWGCEAHEATGQLQGDDLVPVPNMQATRAINIDATPEMVWAWLAQMGRDRSGFYAFDRLDNWGVPSVRYIRQDLPPLKLNTRLDNDLKVFGMQPSEYLLVGGFDIPTFMGIGLDITYLYQLVPLNTGQTRLLVRMRGQTVGLKGWVYNRLFEMLDSITIIRQLQEIKIRAEAMPQSFGEPRINIPIAADGNGHHPKQEINQG